MAVRQPGPTGTAKSAEDANIDAFKEASSHFPTGVTVVTSRLGDRIYGTTVSAFAPLSLRPTLIMVSLHRDGLLPRFIAGAGCLGVSILASGQQAISRYFASHGRGPSRTEFPEVSSVVRVTGAPLIAGAVALLDCHLSRMYEVGDHLAVIAEVVDVEVPSGEPLVHCRRRFASLGPAA